MTPSDAVPASGTVHVALLAAILEGELAPGDPIPSERTLAERHAVNRHAVREALKRLQQAGLVVTSQGGATCVLDWRHHAGLDLLLDLMRHGEAPPPELIGAILEMRAGVGIDAVRRCCERAPRDQRAAIGAHAAAAAELAAGTDRAELVDAYSRLWELIVDGAANVAYRLALNSLNAALEVTPDLAVALTPDEPESLRRLGDAVAAGEAESATIAARELLEGDIDRDA